ncbi:hypothetical protein ACYSNR_14905 [Enterococcus sp. LJL128]
MKKYLGFVLIALFILAGCGGSKSSQGKEIVKAVYEFNKDDGGGYGHYSVFNQKDSNATVYETPESYYVLLETQEEYEYSNSTRKYVGNAIYKVRRHEKFEISQSDIEPEYNEDILRSATDIFYEEKNIKLIDEQ